MDDKTIATIVKAVREYLQSTGNEADSEFAARLSGAGALRAEDCYRLSGLLADVFQIEGDRLRAVSASQAKTREMPIRR
jgi:hypothetical protein